MYQLLDGTKNPGNPGSIKRGNLSQLARWRQMGMRISQGFFRGFLNP